jgi:hypothetical protein
VDRDGDAIKVTVLTDRALVTGELERAANAEASQFQIDDLSGANLATDEYNFIWSDFSDSRHNDIRDLSPSNDTGKGDSKAGNDWTNGYLVTGLPTSPITVKY